MASARHLFVRMDQPPVARACAQFVWQWLIVIGGSLLLSLLTGCQSNQPIPVGFSAGLTGRNAALGVDGRDGALMAIRMINEQGGIDGREIELLIEDDLATQEGALAADRRLIDAGVVAIIGHMTSETGMAVKPLIDSGEVLYLSPTISTPQLAGLEDNFFRVIPVNTLPATALAEYAVRELKLKRMAIIYDVDNQAYTGTFQSAFATRFADFSGEIITTLQFSSASEPDFKPLVEQLVADEPDTILVVASAVDTALIAQQIRLLDLGLTILTSNWALTDDLLQNGGEAVNGILAVVTHDESNRSPQYQAFETRFIEEYGREPTFAASYGYEAAVVLAAALQKTDGKPEGLYAALLETDAMIGINGRITFNAYGDVTRTLYLIEVGDAGFTTLTSLETDLAP